MAVNLTDARRRWLAELYQANSAAVFNQSRRLLGSREDAADATQEVFLRAAASLTEAPDSPQARAWLTTVTRNYCIDLLRRRERFGSALTTLGATAGSAGDPVETVEDRQLLQAVLQQMGVRERQALWRSAVEDLPLGEVARSFGVSYLAAAQLLHRARRRALVLATRLAVIVGLAQLRQPARRSNLALRSQQLAAVVVVPLALAVIVVSSSPQRLIGVGATSPQRTASAQSLAATPRNPSPPPPETDTSPVLATGSEPAAQLAGVSAAQTGTIVQPSAMPPAPSDLDKDHGKGRDRDDSIHKHRGHGHAGGQNRLIAGGS
ncbi:MAG: sigma-70 family RNA polymerase sigma factor [Chloroflexi bacterium]|nr:MAG: sigma-70 family RNA polymerase sigma factor [Chloroflexota bacterium]